MAATACAYGYQGNRPPPLTPPARSSSSQSQVPDHHHPFLIGFNDDAEEAAPPPPPPPPPPPRPSPKAPPPFLSRHLGICTEGLGSESSGDIDLSDLSDDAVANNDHAGDDVGHQALMPLPCKRQHRDGDGEEAGRARSARPALFPPPISVIGAGGKPWLYLRHHREGGRLVLQEVRIPTRELLQARREGGRFTLQFAQPLPPEHEEPQDDHHDQCQDQEPADAVVREKRQEENA
ncbi:unnamed protein product [Urochloa decumbens]|uniref:FAF domain-containing protein n=1 Tax=Urochloa decumbens TaxID=240449 RepID=A0ABC8VC05_9POAL